MCVNIGKFSCFSIRDLVEEWIRHWAGNPGVMSSNPMAGEKGELFEARKGSCCLKSRIGVVGHCNSFAFEIEKLIFNCKYFASNCKIVEYELQKYCCKQMQ